MTFALNPLRLTRLYFGLISLINRFKNASNFEADFSNFFF